MICDFKTNGVHREGERATQTPDNILLHAGQKGGNDDTDADLG